MCKCKELLALVKDVPCGLCEDVWALTQLKSKEDKAKALGALRERVLPAWVKETSAIFNAKVAFRYEYKPIEFEGPIFLREYNKTTDGDPLVYLYEFFDPNSVVSRFIQQCTNSARESDPYVPNPLELLKRCLDIIPIEVKTSKTASVPDLINLICTGVEQAPELIVPCLSRRIAWWLNELAMSVYPRWLRSLDLQ